MRNTVSVTLGDPIKIDILLFLWNYFEFPPEDRAEWIPDPEDPSIRFPTNIKLPYYSDILEALDVSSSVLPRKLREMEEDGLIKSEKAPKEHNRKYFFLTNKGNEIADLLNLMNNILLGKEVHYSLGSKEGIEYTEPFFKKKS